MSWMRASALPAAVLVAGMLGSTTGHCDPTPPAIRAVKEPLWLIVCATALLLVGILAGAAIVSRRWRLRQPVARLADGLDI